MGNTKSDSDCLEMLENQIQNHEMLSPAKDIHTLCKKFVHAQFLFHKNLRGLTPAGIKTELVKFYDYQVSP